MIAEGDLASTMDQSNKIREMQDKIAHLRAQVRPRWSPPFSMTLNVFVVYSKFHSIDDGLPRTRQVYKCVLFKFSSSFLTMHHSLTISNCQRQCAPRWWSTNCSCQSEVMVKAGKSGCCCFYCQELDHLFCLSGDEAVVAQRQIVQIPEHAQSGHLFQFVGDILSAGNANPATESNDVSWVVAASQSIRIPAKTAPHLTGSARKL